MFHDFEDDVPLFNELREGRRLANTLVLCDLLESLFAQILHFARIPRL